MQEPPLRLPIHKGKSRSCFYFWCWMEFTRHCAHSKEVLGEEFPEVHLWLDEFFRTSTYKTKHRFLRHHKQGVEEVRKLFGDKAAQAALLHVLDDIRTGEKADATEADIPLDSEDYKKRGYW